MVKNNINNLEEIYKEIGELTDYKTAEVIYENFKGCQIYFPKCFFSKEKIEKDIKDDYYNKQMSIRRISKKYGTTTRYIRGVIRVH